MADRLACASLALCALAAFLPGGFPGWALIAAFALALAAAAWGARGALALFAATLSLGLWFFAPGGAGALLTALGQPPAAFFRANAWALDFGSLVLLAGVAMLAFRRRGNGAFAAAAETAEDLDRAVVAIGRWAGYLFVPMMIVIMYDVTQRKLLEFDAGFIDSVFYLSSTKLQELEWHLHGTLFCLALGMAYVHDAHVRIELVRDRLPARARVWLELAGAVLFLLAYCFVIVKFGATFAWRAFATNEVSSAQTGLSHRWIIKSVLPIGFAILAAGGVAAVLRSAVYLFGPESLRHAAARYTGAQHPAG
jgi:TRAP-type mannitol/chloroaromatic compound transport system permease small subunit